MTAQRIIQHIFQKPELARVSIVTVEELVEEYPYFTAARLLLAQKNYEQYPSLHSPAVKKAQLYSNNPHYFFQFVTGELERTAAAAPSLVQADNQPVNGFREFAEQAPPPPPPPPPMPQVELKGDLPQLIREREEIRALMAAQALAEEAEAKAEALAKAEEEAREKAKAEALAKAEEEARLKAEEEARAKAEEEARLKAEEEARAKAEEEARLKAEEEARLKAEEEARLKAEEEARLKAEEEARLKAEEEARLKAEEEARLKAEEEAGLKAEDAAGEEIIPGAEEEIRNTADPALPVAELPVNQQATAEEEEPIKIFPLEIPQEETTLTFQPLYTDDYFAYKRLKEPENAEELNEKGMADMRSFTDWLREMKHSFAKKADKDWYHQQLHRIYVDDDPEVSEAVEKMAMESITLNDDIVSETLAEIWARQRQYQTAIQIYQKLSLLNPNKSAYFAQKIQELQLAQSEADKS
jgi:hypothetical protein